MKGLNLLSASIREDSDNRGSLINIWTTTDFDRCRLLRIWCGAGSINFATFSLYSKFANGTIEVSGGVSLLTLVKSFTIKLSLSTLSRS